MHWALTHEILLEDMPRLEQCLLVRYEDLCARPDDHLRLLERFLELSVPFESTANRHFRSHNIDGTPKPLQDLNARSLQRLTRSDLDIINRHVSRVAARFQYDLL